MGITMEQLSKQHNRAAFSCGQAALDDWVRQRASQGEKRNIARVFVAVDDEHGVVGFYSLSSFSMAVDSQLSTKPGQVQPCLYDAARFAWKIV
jgi:hypothetical protein